MSSPFFQLSLSEDGSYECTIQTELGPATFSGKVRDQLWITTTIPFYLQFLLNDMHDEIQQDELYKKLMITAKELARAINQSYTGKIPGDGEADP